MKQSFITEPLGLFGWKHLEPILLAALASESPMLLIGRHGVAKSFILEKLAKALHLNYRFYNASLINYDDLVGIPIPVNNNTELSYISNPNSIWDAEVVFIDEINRTKPELQNKLFPIIYDKRVQGQNLDKLRFRWAAMNPPIVDEEEEDFAYQGVSLLDPALADRFPFLIEVPEWDNLSEEDRKNMLFDAYQGEHDFPIDINGLILETKDCMESIINNELDDISKYILSLMDLLTHSFGYVSSRRATTLQDTLIAVYAASKVLSKYTDEQVSFKQCALLHIQNTFPDIANKNVDKVKLLNVATQALKICKLDESYEKEVLLINDPVRQMTYMINHSKDLSTDTVCDVLTNALSKIDNPYRRAVALIAYLKLRTNSRIHAAAMETLALEIRPLLEVKMHKSQEYVSKKRIADNVDKVIAGLPKKNTYNQYVANLLYSFLPDDYADEHEPRRLYEFFCTVAKDVKLT